MTQNNDTDKTKNQHEKDVFRPGDKVPWSEDYGIVTARTFREEIPEEVADYMHPREHSEVERNDDVPYVILTIDLPDKTPSDECLTTATWLYENTREQFNEMGLPAVTTDKPLGMQTSSKVKVQTPATGNRKLTPQEADELADFLRDNADFDPLHKLLGGTDDEREMRDIANALNRAANAIRIHKRAE